MSKNITIVTKRETLDLIRRAISHHLDELERYNETHETDYQELEKIYNKLVDLTFKEEE